LSDSRLQSNYERKYLDPLSYQKTEGEEGSKVIEQDHEGDEDIRGRKPYNDLEDDSHMAELQQRNVQIMQKEDEQKLNF